MTMTNKIVASSVVLTLGFLAAAGSMAVARAQRNSSGGDSFILYRGDSKRYVFNGSVHEMERVESTNRNLKTPYLWLRKSGKEYILEDAAELAKLDKLFEAENALARKQEEIGAQQSRLGEKQSALGQQQSAVSVDARGISEVASQIAAEIAARAKANATQEELGRMQASASKLQAELSELQARAGSQQAELGGKQAELGKQQAELGARQAELGRQQAEESKRIQQKLSELSEAWVRSGKARAVR